MSQLNVDIIKNRSGTGGPTLQQLTVTTNALISGVVTATSFVGNLTGTATSTTAASNAYGLLGAPNLNVGVVTATSFVGNLTGSATYAATAGISTVAQGLTGTPNLNVGVVTASSFVGTLTGTATTATTAGYAPVAGIATYSTTAGIATYATSSGIATYATTAGISTYANTAGIATSLLGGNAGVNTTSTPTNLYVSGNAASNIVGLGTTNANTALNFGAGNNFSLQLTGSIVLSNPTGVTTGQSGIILIQQDSVGSKTCGFGSHWDFPSSTAPTLSTGANALDALTYFVRSSTSIVTSSLIGIGTL